jgi:RNA polymerase sigma factor (sigma-70 family)
MAERTMKSIEPETAERWQKISQGNTQEFAGFVDQYKNLLTSIAYSLIGDLQGSEDIAQESFLAAWQSRKELRDTGKLVGWLSAITRNLAKQWIRQRSARSWPSTDLDSTNLQQESPHPADRLVSEEEQHLVWSVLESIPENYREVLILYYRQSHSIADVALALEITDDAARQRLSRGRNLLRAEVERTIESALANSRPSASFTAGVISIITATSWSTTAKAATTASAGLIGKFATKGTAVAAMRQVACSERSAGSPEPGLVFACRS